MGRVLLAAALLAGLAFPAPSYKSSGDAKGPPGPGTSDFETLNALANAQTPGETIAIAQAAGMAEADAGGRQGRQVTTSAPLIVDDFGPHLRAFAEAPIRLAHTPGTFTVPAGHLLGLMPDPDPGEAWTDETYETLARDFEGYDGLLQVDLYFVPVTDAGLACVARLPGLTELKLESCPDVTPSGFAALASAPRLAALRLSGSTSVTDADLAALAPAPALEELDLRRCAGLTGACMASLAAMPNLRALTIGECSGIPDAALVEGLCAMPRLEEADVSGYALRGGVGARLTELAGLHALSVREAPGLADADMVGLTKLEELQALTFEDAPKLTDATVARVAQLGGLRELSLVHMDGVTGEGLGPLASLSRLEELDLLSIPLPGETLGFVRSLGALRSLFVSSLEGPVGLRELSGLPDLEDVMLGCDFDGGGLLVTALPALGRARFSGGDYGKVRFEHLPSLADVGFDMTSSLEGIELVDVPALRSLSFSTWPLTDEQLGALVRSLPAGFESLWLEAGPELSDAGVAALGELHSLRDLRLTADNVTDAGLAHISLLTRLWLLQLRCPKLTDAGLARISGLTALRHLELRCPRVTDAGLADIAKLENLTGLRVDAEQVTDAGLAHISRLTGLRMLALRCPEMTDAGLAEIGKLADLTWLTVDGGALTDAGKAALEAKLPNCEIHWL
jgi:hypothetical protein